MSTVAAVPRNTAFDYSDSSPDESVGDTDNSVLCHGAKEGGVAAARIDLAGTALTKDVARQLILSLQTLPDVEDTVGVEANASAQLRALRLCPTELTTTVTVDLLTALRPRASHLLELDLSGARLGDEAADALAGLLPASLAALNLSDSHLSDTGLETVLRALEASGAALERLNLSGNRFGPRSAALLGVLLSSRWAHSLHELVLAFCGLSDGTAPAVLEGVHKAIALHALDLSQNDCGLSLASPLSPLRPVTFPAGLRALKLSQNAIRPVLARGLAMSIVSCTGSLEELWLAGCLEGDEPLAVFFATVRGLPKLRVLDLSHCRLTYRSGKLLAQKLRAFGALERVYLAGNVLDVEGISDLASGLERMQRLTTLHLGGCHLGTCGAASAVRSIVRGAAPVRELDLSENAITDIGVRDLCTQLSSDASPKLDLLVLSKNPCTLQSRAQLAAMMRGRQSDCVVVAWETPLEEVASSGGSLDTRTSSESLSVLEWV